MLGTKHSNNNQTVSLFKYHVKNVLFIVCVCSKVGQTHLRMIDHGELTTIDWIFRDFFCAHPLII